MTPEGGDLKALTDQWVELLYAVTLKLSGSASLSSAGMCIFYSVQGRRARMCHTSVKISFPTQSRTNQLFDMLINVLMRFVL